MKTVTVRPGLAVSATNFSGSWCSSLGVVIISPKCPQDKLSPPGLKSLRMNDILPVFLRYAWDLAAIFDPSNQYCLAAPAFRALAAPKTAVPTRVTRHAAALATFHNADGVKHGLFEINDREPTVGTPIKAHGGHFPNFHNCHHRFLSCSSRSLQFGQKYRTFSILLDPCESAGPK